MGQVAARGQVESHDAIMRPQQSRVHREVCGRAAVFERLMHSQQGASTVFFMGMSGKNALSTINIKSSRLFNRATKKY